MAGQDFRDKVKVKKRILVALVLVIGVFLGLTIRLSYIMFFKQDKYKALATQQWTSDVKINAKRGRILDRNEQELAVSANVYRADLDLNTLRKSLSETKLTMEQISKSLCTILSMDEKKVYDILTKPLPNGKPKGSAILKRRIDKNESDGIKAYCKENGLKGILVSPDTKRYYPNGAFASHLLGHTNSDGEGLTGIELYYNKYLAGLPGIKIAEIDKKSEDMPYKIAEFTEPVDGRDLVLTIDENIQGFAEKLASEALKDNEAKAVSIMVMDPNNGEIVAMANKPDYNPNDPWPMGISDIDTQKMWRNRVVSDAYEPGSIFKVVTATAAIDKKVLKPGETFNCGGSLTIGGRHIHCWKRTGHGPLDFQGIIKNSCNVGFMTLGERMGREALNEYIYKFGFGQKTGIDLPGEAKGIVKATDKISITDLATISFGQSNTTTAIQYMRAFNAIANGGFLITPHVMKEIIHYDENNNRMVDATFSNYNKEQKFNNETMEEMRKHLEATVNSGGSSKSKIDGYRIAGKTGTAQKIDTVNGGYAQGRYISSFAAMAPADAPRYTVFISIDEPNPSMYYAGQIAAPVGKKLFNDIFNYAGIKPTKSEAQVAESLKSDIIVPEVRGNSIKDAQKILKGSKLSYEVEGDGENVIEMTPKPGYTVKEGNKIILHTSEGNGNNSKEYTMIMPDFRGSTKEACEKLLKELGMKVEFIGDGVVIDQSIGAGVEIKKGTSVICYLGVATD